MIIFASSVQKVELNTILFHFYPAVDCPNGEPECAQWGDNPNCIYENVKMDCPVTCGLCEPPCDGKICENEGTLDTSECTCTCQPIYTGDTCETRRYSTPLNYDVSREEMTCNANILDVSTKLIPLWSPSHPLPQEPAYDSQTPLFQDITNLSMLFIFQLTRTSWIKITGTDKFTQLIMMLAR